MAVKLLPLPFQYANNVGQPLAGGSLTFFLAGTTTPSATFTDVTGTVPLANPLVLDSSGRVGGGNEVWGTVGITYKVVVKDSGGTTLVTLDNLSAINDTSAAATNEWLPQSSPTFISGTSFSVAGNQTAVFQVGRRVLLSINSGSIYGTIKTSVFTSLTTVTFTPDSGAIDNTLSAVSIGLLGETNPSVPQIIPYNQVAFRAFRSTAISSGTSIVYDTVVFQNGGTNYNNSTGVFTFPYTGIYLLGANGYFGPGNAGGALQGLSITASGGSICESSVNFISGDNVHFSCSAVHLATAGDTAGVATYNMATIPLIGSVENNFWACLLQRTA